VSYDTLLDAPLRHKFCASLPQAEQQARREAADTGAILLRIKSFRIEPRCVVLTGQIPSTALVFEHPSEHPAHLQPRSVGTLHLTWNSLFHPADGEELGYLVMQTPIAATGQLPESEDGDAQWVSLAVERSFHTLPPASIGAACCARCNRPIARQRLIAVPNTRVCTDCQQKKETK
jgi:hypothetical protein